MKWIQGLNEHTATVKTPFVKMRVSVDTLHSADGKIRYEAAITTHNLDELALVEDKPSIEAGKEWCERRYREMLRDELAATASLTVIKSCSPMCFPPFSPAARSDGGDASKSAVGALSCAAWRSARRCVPGWNEARLVRCERRPREAARPCGRAGNTFVRRVAPTFLPSL